MIVKSLKCLFILFSCIMIYDPMITWHMMLTWYRHVILDTWYLTPTLICYTWHLLYDTWYLTPVLDILLLDSWSLTLDTRHQYLTCYHLTPDTWYLTLDMLSLDTWHMLSPGTDTFDMILWHLTGYYYTWHLYYIAYSWLSPVSYTHLTLPTIYSV